MLVLRSKETLRRKRMEPGDDHEGFYGYAPDSTFSLHHSEASQLQPTSNVQAPSDGAQQQTGVDGNSFGMPFHVQGASHPPFGAYFNGNMGAFPRPLPMRPPMVFNQPPYPMYWEGGFPNVPCNYAPQVGPDHPVDPSLQGNTTGRSPANLNSRKNRGKKTAQVASTHVPSDDGGNDRSPPYTHKEDDVLMSIWLRESSNPIRNTSRDKKTYWEKITEDFNRESPAGITRTLRGLESRMSTINGDVNRWIQALNKAGQIVASGSNQDDVEKEAQLRYAKMHKNKRSFDLMHCYDKLKDEHKWRCHVGLDRTGSKKRSSSSGYTGTPGASNNPSVHLSSDEDSPRAMGIKKAKAKMMQHSDSFTSPDSFIRDLRHTFVPQEQALNAFMQQMQQMELLKQQDMQSKREERKTLMEAKREERITLMEGRRRMIHAKLEEVEIRKHQRQAAMKAEEERREAARKAEEERTRAFEKSIMDADLSSMHPIQRKWYEREQLRIVNARAANGDI